MVEYEPLVLASLERAQHPKALLWCMSATICAQSETGQYELIERRAKRIIEEGERVGDADLVCQALWSWAFARIKQRRLDEAIEMCTLAIEIAPTIGGKAWAPITLAWALVEMDPPRAISLVEPLVDIFRTTSPLSFGWVGFELGEALMHAGRLDDAEAILEEVRTRGLNLYMPHHVAYSYLLLGEVALRRETLDIAKAENHFIQASHWAAQCRMRVVHAISLEGHGKLFARTGRADEARAKFQSAKELHFALGTVGAQEMLAHLIERLPD